MHSIHSFFNTNIVFLDGGARGGLDDTWLWLENILDIIAFEPELEEFQSLNTSDVNRKSKNNKIFPYAIHNKNEKLNLHVTRDGASSSLYIPNKNYVSRFTFSKDLEVIKENEVKCVTLDSLYDQFPKGGIDILKLDTQGNEYDILIGGKKTLKDVLVVDIEIEFIEMYKNQKLFSEVDEILRNNNFTFFGYLGSFGGGKRSLDMMPSYSKKQILWAHALYFKDYVNFNGKEKIDINRDKALKIILISAHLGYFDFSIELLYYFSTLKIISNDEKIIINKILLKYSKLKGVALKYDKIFLFTYSVQVNNTQ